MLPTLPLIAVLLQEAKPAAGEATTITISPDVLKQLAEAEAARAEKMGSAASSSEVQSRVNDAMERIVEQASGRVGGAGTRCRALSRAGRHAHGGSSGRAASCGLPAAAIDSRRVARPPH